MANKMIIAGAVVAAAAVLLVAVLLAGGVFDKGQTEPEDDSVTVRLFVDQCDGNYTELSATGKTVKDAVVAALGDDIRIKSNGTIASYKGVEAPSGYAWALFQWDPPMGWSSIVFGKAADNRMVAGTSYCINMSKVSTDGEGVNYSKPAAEPMAKAKFFIQFRTEYDANEEISAYLTAEERQNGFWISGYGSDIAEAFQDACDKAGISLVMSSGVKEDGSMDADFKGWLISFFGLSDEQVVKENIWIYWSQYYWDQESKKWVYSQTMGHYDPSVTPYFSLIRQGTTVEDVDYGPEITPEDYRE